MDEMEGDSYPVPQVSFMKYSPLQRYNVETSNSSNDLKGGTSDPYLKQLLEDNFEYSRHLTSGGESENSMHLSDSTKMIQETAEKMSFLKYGSPHLSEMSSLSGVSPSVKKEKQNSYLKTSPCDDDDKRRQEYSNYLSLIANYENSSKCPSGIAHPTSLSKSTHPHSVTIATHPTSLSKSTHPHSVTIATHSTSLTKATPEREKLRANEDIKSKDGLYSKFRSETEGCTSSWCPRPKCDSESNVISTHEDSGDNKNDSYVKCSPENNSITILKKKGTKSDLFRCPSSIMYMSHSTEVAPKQEVKIEENNQWENLPDIGSDDPQYSEFVVTPKEKDEKSEMRDEEMEVEDDSSAKPEPDEEFKDKEYPKCVIVTKERESNSGLSKCPSKVMQIIFDSDEDEESPPGDSTNQTVLGRESSILPGACHEQPKQVPGAYSDPTVPTSQSTGSNSLFHKTTELFQTFLQSSQQQHSDMMKTLNCHNNEMMVGVGNTYSLSNPGNLLGRGLLLNSVNPLGSNPTGAGSSQVIPVPTTGAVVSALLGEGTTMQGISPEKKTPNPPKEKRHKCSLCGKSFGRSSDLKRHIRIHTGERNHKCLVCEKAFNQSGDLQRHMKTHTGEKPHVCVVCTKAFAQSGDLKIHMRIHTGEKPHVCSVCHKAFNQSSYLSTHMKSHTGERPHVCFVCNKAFIENSDLKKHMRIHTGEKPHQCSICNKAFNRNNNLIRHIMNIHGREKTT